MNDSEAACSLWVSQRASSSWVWRGVCHCLKPKLILPTAKLQKICLHWQLFCTKHSHIENVWSHTHHYHTQLNVQSRRVVDSGPEALIVCLSKTQACLKVPHSGMLTAKFQFREWILGMVSMKWWLRQSKRPSRIRDTYLACKLSIVYLSTSLPCNLFTEA